MIEVSAERFGTCKSNVGLIKVGGAARHLDKKRGLNRFQSEVEEKKIH